jgi:hypothetical protein
VECVSPQPGQRRETLLLAYPGRPWPVRGLLALPECPLHDLFLVHLYSLSRTMQKDLNAEVREKKNSPRLPFTKETSD